MKATEFCYWLQGFFELRDNIEGGLTINQAKAIQQHLSLVFKHDIDPQAGPPEYQAELQAIHDGVPVVGGGRDPKTGAVMRC